MLLYVNLKYKLRISGYPQVSQLLYEILYVHDASLYVPQTRTLCQGDIYKIHIHNRRYVMAMVLFPVYLEPDFTSWGTHKAHNHIVIHFMAKMLSHVYCINGLPDVKLFLFDVSLFD